MSKFKAWLCRIGFHKWVEGKTRGAAICYTLTDYHCSRCGAFKTELGP